MSRTRSIVPAAVLAVVALTGCDAVKNFLSTAPAPVPSATPSPAPSATAAPSASATATPTPDPSATPKPTVTTMYVMNGLSKTIDAVNLKTGVVTKSVLTTGLYPNQLLADGSTGYLVNSGDANLIKLDLLAKSQLGTLDLPVDVRPLRDRALPAARNVIRYQRRGEQRRVPALDDAEILFIGEDTPVPPLPLPRRPNQSPGSNGILYIGDD